MTCSLSLDIVVSGILGKKQNDLDGLTTPTHDIHMQSSERASSCMYFVAFPPVSESYSFVHVLR